MLSWTYWLAWFQGPGPDTHICSKVKWQAPTEHQIWANTVMKCMTFMGCMLFYKLWGMNIGGEGWSECLNVSLMAIRWASLSNELAQAKVLLENKKNDCWFLLLGLLEKDKTVGKWAENGRKSGVYISTPYTFFSKLSQHSIREYTFSNAQIINMLCPLGSLVEEFAKSK